MEKDKKLKRIYWIFGALIVMLFLGLIAVGLKNMHNKLSAAPFMPDLPLAVKTIAPERGSLSYSVPALATVKSAASIQIRAETGGTIVQLMFREGDLIKAGQKIAVIDSREQDAQLSAAQARENSSSSQVSAMNANIAALSSQVASLKINLQYWDDEKARAERLFKAMALPKSALDNIVNRRSEAESKLLSLKAQIRSQQAQLASIKSQQKAAEQDVKVWKVRRDYTEVVSPVDAIVSARLEEEGNRVNPGSAIYNVENTSATRLHMQIPQESAAQLRVGQKVMLKDFPVAEFFVSRIHPVQNSFRQVTVEAEIQGSIDGLVYDMVIPVRIVVKDSEGLIIPPEAQFINFVDESRIFIYEVVHNVATRKSVQPLFTGDEGFLLISPEEVSANAAIAVGPYLENVRLPASFTVEVVR